MTDSLTGQTVELLQTLIRNACVNDGTAGSGHESRSAEVLQTLLEGPGITTERYEPTPGRASLVARIEGSDPSAPSVCLMGHTDVVPANPASWQRDPFGGELVDGEVWGRGAVDMLNLTASMAVAVRDLVRRGFRPRGDLIAPYRSDNALVKAAAVIQRLTAYSPAPRAHEMWRQQLASLHLDDDTMAELMDPARIDDALAAMPLGVARHLHACSHTTFSCNMIEGPMKHNTIPGAIDIGVDTRTLPGEDGADVERHLIEALGDLAADVAVEIVMNDPASSSRIDNPMWDALQRGVTRQFPTARLAPQMMVGFTDARIFRRLGSVAYGTGLFSPDLHAGD